MQGVTHIRIYSLITSSLIMMSLSYAGAPAWTFTPLTATTISVPTNSSTTIQYQVTNQSKKSHTLTMTSIPGMSQDTASGNCPNPFTLNYRQSCTLTLTVQGSTLQGHARGGPVVCQQGNALQCYQPNSADVLNVSLMSAPAETTLLASVSHLALETDGAARTITITNTGSNPAESLFIHYPPWPTGTTANSTCGSTLGATDSCTITVTPGAHATSDCNAGTGSAPTPGVISVSSSNVTASLTTDVEVLTYGCIYQEGYIYAIDDTTPTDRSIGGTTATLSDNTSSRWYNNGTYVITNAQSINDGITNTATIISIQGAGNYAAELCNTYTIDSSGNSPCSTGTCYSSWYLPAICQMGAPNEGAGCTSGTQNMVTNLSALITGCSGLACLSGNYWSSTEYSIDPQYYAWYEGFSSGSSTQVNYYKFGNLRVRCSRDLTP